MRAPVGALGGTGERIATNGVERFKKIHAYVLLTSKCNVLGFSSELLTINSCIFKTGLFRVSIFIYAPHWSSHSYFNQGQKVL